MSLVDERPSTLGCISYVYYILTRFTSYWWRALGLYPLFHMVLCFSGVLFGMVLLGSSLVV